MKSVVMVIAPRNFRDPEYYVPKKVLQKGGINIVTASTMDEAVGAEGNIQKIDLKVNEIGPKYDGVIFVGGGGASVYFNDPDALRVAKQYFSAGKLVAAICIAPSILANAGVLKGKMATSFPSELSNLREKGAVVKTDRVSVDGKVVTANGPAAAEEFGKKILEILSK
jgi:protease I